MKRPIEFLAALAVILVVSLSQYGCGKNFKGPADPAGAPTSTPTSPVAFTPTSTFAYPATLTPSASPTIPVSVTSTPTNTFPVTFIPTGTFTYPVTLTPSVSPTIPISVTSTPSFAFTPTNTYPVSLTPTGTFTYPATLTPSVSPTIPVSVTSTPSLAFTPTNTYSVTSTPAASTTPGRLDVSGFVSMGGGTFNYRYVQIYEGGNLYISGPATFNVTDYFAMDAGATLVGFGFSAAGSPASGSGGAGHGGTGGADGQGHPGGSAYDSVLSPTEPGSLGGNGGCGGTGGIGGGFIEINAPSGYAALNGGIILKGWNSSCTTPNGAGSGGTLFVQADDIEGNGFITTDGGNGGVDGADPTLNAGGGGGGIIVLSHHTADNFTGTVSVTGGGATAPASPGSDGAFNRTSY